MGELMTGMSFEEIAANARRALGSVDSVRERRPPGVDKFSPTPQTMDWESPEAAGFWNDVGPGCHVVFKRDPEQYPQEPDEIAELMYRIPEAQIVTRKKDGKPLTSWDLIGVSVPIKYKHLLTVDEADRYMKWEASVDQDSGNSNKGVRARDPEFQMKAQAAAAEAERRSRDLRVGKHGNTVSETADMDIELARRVMGLERTRAIEAQERRGGRHITRTEEEARRADQARARERGSTAFGGLRGTPEYDRWQRSGDRERAERRR
jgi:hypothetical protein